MTCYSKKLKKYTKNIKPRTKRRRIRRKKSIRNKKLHGGFGEREFIFSCDNKNYTLTKDRGIFESGAGVGKYTLKASSPAEPNPISIEGSGVDDFISKLILNITSDKNEKIIKTLYYELLRVERNHPFHFNTLITRLKKQIIWPLSNDMSIEDFHKYIYNKVKDFTALFESVPDDNNNILKARFNRFKRIYDNVLTEFKKRLRSKSYLMSSFNSILELYRYIPLYKINPELKTLSSQPDKTLWGNDRYSTIYKISVNGTYRLLKIINVRYEHIDDMRQFINKRISEIMYYYRISTECEKPKPFCEFINIDYDENYENDIRSINIYVLMENCSSLYTIMTERVIPENEIAPNIYKWLLNIAKGIQCMHSNNYRYAHFDINPTNIAIDTDTNESKLINLGVMHHFYDIIELDILTTFKYKYMPTETSDIFKELEKNPFDNYSLGITFIECAFAFHYREQYIKIISLQSSSLFDCVLRCVPPIKTEPDTLNLYCHKLRGLAEIGYTGENYSKDIVVCVLDDKTNYTLGNLYTDIMDIHATYPIFRKMIEIEPHNRYSIKNVIRELKLLLQ
jgi:hypothetical protein